MGEEPLNEAQPPITVDQITSIVLAIVNSKLATLSSMPGLAKASTAEPAVNFGDPNSVHQLLSTPSSNSGDLAAHADEKTWKAIVKGEYVDFVSLLHENSTASPHRSRSAYPNHQWRILTHFFSEPEESSESPHRFISLMAVGFLCLFYHPFIYLSTLGSGTSSSLCTKNS